MQNFGLIGFFYGKITSQYNIVFGLGVLAIKIAFFGQKLRPKILPFFGQKLRPKILTKGGPLEILKFMSCSPPPGKNPADAHECEISWAHFARDIEITIFFVKNFHEKGGPLVIFLKSDRKIQPRGDPWKFRKFFLASPPPWKNFCRRPCFVVG